MQSKFVANTTTTDEQGRTVLECYLSYSQWGQLPGKPTGRSDPPGSSCECHQSAVATRVLTLQDEMAFAEA